MNKARLNSFFTVLFVAAGGLHTSSALAGPAAERLAQFYNHTQTLRAEFTQTVRDSRGAPVSRSQGHFSLKRPALFRWEYTAPYAQTLVADGTRLWVYDPDLNQVTVKTQADGLANTPAALLSGTRPLSSDFDINETGVKDGLAWLELRPKRPKEGELEFEVVRLGFDDATLRTMEISDPFGQRTLLEFSKVQYNPNLPPPTFRFVPPAGVDVVKQ